MKTDTEQLKKDIGERLKQARNALAMTQKELCASIGMPLQSLLSYELGKRIPGGEAISDLMRAGINANWLLTGEGPMRLADLARAGEVSGGRVYAPIPRYVVLGKNGEERDIPSEIASLALELKWLEQKGLLAKDLIYVRMPDDSMMPTIRDGSLVVLDGISDSFRGDGLYGMICDGAPAVKRLQKDFSGGLYIRSDNPAYREQRIEESQLDRLFIIGKVVWSGGEI